jgi:hypothetical protein
MAYQRDYIMRMIEMIGELVAGILGMLKKGQLDRASEAIEHAFVDILREDAAFFIAIPPEELTEVLLREHNYTRGHLEVLAELFYAQAELMYAQGNGTGSLGYFNRSMKLLEFVMKESNTFSFAKQERLKQIRTRVAELEKND